MLSARVDLPNASSVSARETSCIISHDGRIRKFGPTIPVNGGFARRSGEHHWIGDDRLAVFQILDQMIAVIGTDPTRTPPLR